MDLAMMSLRVACATTHLSASPGDGAFGALDEVVCLNGHVGDGCSGEDVGPLSCGKVDHGGVRRGREGERKKESC